MLDRFAAKVDVTDDCWLWTAAKYPNGYGVFSVAAGQNRLAHRVAYELLVGPIPDGMQLDHLCRTRHCVNPAHLEPVTGIENRRRGAGFGGALHEPVTHCPQGHAYEEHGRRNTAGFWVCKPCDNARGARRRAAS